MATKNGAMIARTKEVNAAAKRLKAGEAAPGVKAVWPITNAGVDNQPAAVVESVHGSNTDRSSTQPKESTMTTAPTKTKQELDAEKAQAKIAEKAAKQKAAEDKKAQANAEKAVKAEERAKAAAEAKARRDATIAERQKAAEEAGSKRTYFGSMLTLSEKVKAGAYVKGMNGQLRSGDEVATTLEACSPGNVVKLMKQVLVPIDPALASKYDSLNIGQQSMNLRNKFRGFLKAGKVTIAALQEARDAGGFADIEGKLAEKAQAKLKREQEAAAAKAAKEAKKAEAPKAAVTA